MFLPGDRVRHVQEPGTFEFLAYENDFTVACIESRSGRYMRVPVTRLQRAQLIEQPDGSMGSEYQPGQKILLADFNRNVLRQGTFTRYLTQEELRPFRSYSHEDYVYVEVDSTEVVTDVTRLVVDPQGVDRYSLKSAKEDTDKYHVLSSELRDEFQAAIDRLNFEDIDWNGHLKRGVLWKGDGWYGSLAKRAEELRPSMIFLHSVSEEQARAFIEAEKTRSPLTTWLNFGKSAFGQHYLRCPYCEGSEYSRWLESDGVSVRVGGAPCPNPDGMVDNHFTLNIPSGKLLVANDLRQLTPVNGTFDVNGSIGTMKTTDAYAEAGMAHGYVGNSCPGVYQLSDGSFTIGRYDRDEDDDSDNEDEEYEDLPEGAQRVASICTDLWWYSIMDYDLARSRCEALKRSWKEVLKDSQVVTVEPGTYTFTQYNDIPDRDGPKVIYAEFRRTGDATPDVGDTYLDHFLNQQVTAHEAIAQKIKDWPTLFLKGTPDSVASVAAAADHIMCVNGNGGRFHKNGHPIGTIDTDTVPLSSIPVLRGMQRWYPMSPGYSVIFRAAGLFAPKPYGPGSRKGRYGEHLNKSFQEVAFRILQNIISYGQKPYDSPPPKSSKTTQEEAVIAERKHCRSIMADCVKAFHRLCERYPETFPQVDPQFTAWMQNKKAVTYWVEQLALDPPERTPLVQALWQKWADAERVAFDTAVKPFLTKEA